MTSWSSSIKICFYKLIESIIKKNMSRCETMQKNMSLVKQTVMKLEVFILKQRIDQKRKKGWGRRRRERIEKGEQRDDREREKRDKRELS